MSRRDEDHLQFAACRLLDELDALFFHSANEAMGRLERRVSSVFSGLGVNPGVPDLLVFGVGPIWELPVQDPDLADVRLVAPPPGLALELKSATGRLKPDQKRWLAALKALGWVVAVPRSWSELCGALRGHGFDVDRAIQAWLDRGEGWDGSRWARFGPGATLEEAHKAQGQAAGHGQITGHGLGSDQPHKATAQTHKPEPKVSRHPHKATATSAQPTHGLTASTGPRASNHGLTATGPHGSTGAT